MLELHEMLKYDDEYISAIFKALPGSERTEWLKFDKTEYSSEWDAMVEFLEEAHERATNTKAHLTNYATQNQSIDELRCRKCNKKGHVKKDCTVATVRVKKDPEDTENQIKHKFYKKEVANPELITARKAFLVDLEDYHSPERCS